MYKITIYLNKSQWQWMANTLRDVVELAPVRGYETETCVMAEMYCRRLHQFTFYKAGKMGMALSLHASEAYAINRYLGATSEEYNVFLRMYIEPKLLAGK